MIELTKQNLPEPVSVFRWFYELNQIPRGSGNEKGVSDWLLSVAKGMNLEAHQDKAHNIIIKKPASKGYEAAPAVILQGHMDMVCEKVAESTHDFEKDPIRMLIDGDTLRADGTTLGGDDGLAVAYALALLEDEKLVHPALEVLITTNEETGMDGAMAIHAAIKNGEKPLSGKLLLNIDNEDEGVFLVGCAGGANFQVALAAIREKTAKQPGLTLKVHGLKGGHSGQKIIEGRGNAIKLLARLLNKARCASCLDSACTVNELRLGCFEGGSKHNAIPLLAFSCFSVKDVARAKKALESEIAAIKREYALIDPDLSIELGECTLEESYNPEVSARLIDYIFCSPNGVQSMSHDIPGLVQTSLNVAVLENTPEGFNLTSSIRSSLASSSQEVLDRLTRLADRCGLVASSNGSYPAWEIKEESPLRDKALEVWKAMTGREGKIEAIHAGVECGLFSEVMPDVDMLSMGPDLADVHTPNEHLSIPSVGRCYEFIKKLLAELK